MAVEAYLTPSDVKKTIEKKVKPKPSTKELTTIEKPGKAVSASDLENSPDEKKRKRTSKNKAKKTETTISKAEKDATLIITEKPQAAAKISSALGNAIKYSENRVPFYEIERDGEKIIVASAVGHLFNLTYSKGQTGWPIFKLEWQPAHKGKGAAFTKNYYLLLNKLVKRAKKIIIATDYDIEGEVIGWNVLRFIAKKKDAERMKFSTLTKNELVRAYENPMKTLDWGQAYAGETRHKIDWLYGINLSRALMSAIKTSGTFKILSIGRVQGPALKIIVDRDREIENFKSEPFWQVFAKANNLNFKHPKDIFDKKELDEFKEIENATAETTEKEENLSPPHPFDLTTLQREAYKFYRLSPSNTLKVAQTLYLAGIISYPRTSSQKIPKEIEPKKILRKLENRFPFVKEATRKYPIEGNKSDPAHPSIYPTGDFKNLSGDEKKLYELIVKRFISCFSQDTKIANKRISLTADNGKKFTISGMKIIENGWTNIYPVKMEEKSLPDMKGETKIDKIDFKKRETKPLKKYTATSLVTLMEKKNLGTKATRSSIVDTLFKRGYIDGKSIESTELGKKLIESLEKYSPIIIDENLTRQLEEKMEEILQATENWEEKENKTIENVEQLILDISKEFRAHEKNIGEKLKEGITDLRDKQRENSRFMTCPVCKEGNLSIIYSRKTKRNFVACDKYPDCKTTYSLPPNAVIKKTGKVSEEGLPILVALKRGRKPWEFKFDPNWRDNRQNSS